MENMSTGLSLTVWGMSLVFLALALLQGLIVLLLRLDRSKEAPIAETTSTDAPMVPAEAMARPRSAPRSADRDAGLARAAGRHRRRRPDASTHAPAAGSTDDAQPPAGNPEQSVGGSGTDPSEPDLGGRWEARVRRSGTRATGTHQAPGEQGAALSLWRERVAEHAARAETERRATQDCQRARRLRNEGGTREALQHRGGGPAARHRRRRDHRGSLPGLRRRTGLRGVPRGQRGAGRVGHHSGGRTVAPRMHLQRRPSSPHRPKPSRTSLLAAPPPPQPIPPARPGRFPRRAQGPHARHHHCRRRDSQARK